MSDPTAWTERVAPGETERFDALAARLRALQQARAERHPKGRALHYQPHGGLEATFHTLPDLPPWARVGVFADPTSLPAWVRWSNGGTGRRPDDVPDVRGMAVKVVGVPGPKLIPPLRDAVTQDFLGILSPAVPFRSPEEFVTLVEAAESGPLAVVWRLSCAFGVARALGLASTLQKGLAAKVPSLCDATFHSALPIRWGDAAVKFAFHPVSVPDAPPARGERRYRDDLEARVKTGELVFELRLQAFVDEARTPIEDPTVAWDGPWVPVARLVVHQQDPQSDRGRAIGAFVEQLSFDPWHAPEAFRPLGELMRARNAAYRESTLERSAAAEPTGAERF